MKNNFVVSGYTYVKPAMFDMPKLESSLGIAAISAVGATNLGATGGGEGEDEEAEESPSKAVNETLEE